MVITGFIYQVLDKKHKSQAMTLNILKVFNRVSYTGLLRKLEGYGVYGRIFGLI